MAATVTAATGPTRASGALAPPVPAAAVRPRVAVIGAGFAGLAAALTLQRSRCCDVVVLEAGGRPGGRACTQRLSPELALELGATWFHGLGSNEEPNPVFQHAVDQGLIRHLPDGEKWWDPQFLLPGGSQPLSTAQQAAITHVLAAWSDVVESLPPDAAGSTADHLRVAWQQLVKSGKVPAEHAELAQRAWRWREHLQRAMDGCDSTSQQSAQGLALYDEMPGGVHAPLPAGMQAVAERLALQLGDLRYDHAVQRITWGGTTGLRITCSNGATVEADAAVVTVSLGVLKAQHAQLFDPPLPMGKQRAVERLQIGTVDKIFLDFSPAGTQYGAVAGRGRGAAEAAGAAGASTTHGTDSEAQAVSYALLWGDPWDSAADSTGPEQVAGGITSKPPAREAETQLPDWVKGVFSIRFGGPEVKRQLGQQPSATEQQPGSVAAGNHSGRPTSTHQEHVHEAEPPEDIAPSQQAPQPTCYQAIAWVSGEAATAMEAASDEQVLTAMRQLAALFPQLQMPEGASWDAVTLQRSRWGCDPHFRGSYSYLGVGCTPDDVATLAAPVYTPPGIDSHASQVDAAPSNSGSNTIGGTAGHPVLLFAGEATHVKYIGTMHGAYLTGQQQAELLVQHFAQEQQQQPHQRLADCSSSEAQAVHATEHEA